ncbi:hypothetical protein BD311DRAFT_780813 [Dichomitus squalens]|uniref:DUF6532 domain-containing protein n=1 Tax=Dichomitus squalens TaxID=114155 RepID=A0A4V2JZE1_9APHY|nr:hypothetical protein BD311DRAFT_780813 [Dichomitus squalens]
MSTEGTSAAAARIRAARADKAKASVSPSSDQNHRESQRPARESKTKLLQNPTWGSKKARGKPDGQTNSRGNSLQYSGIVESIEGPMNKGIGRPGGRGLQKGKRKRVLSDSELDRSGDEEQVEQGPGKGHGAEQIKVPKKRKQTGAPISQSSAPFEAPTIDVDKSESSSAEEEFSFTKTRARAKADDSYPTGQKERSHELDGDEEAARHNGSGDDEDTDDERPEEHDFAGRMTDTQVSHERINWTTATPSKAHAAGETYNDVEQLSGVNVQSSRENLTTTRPDRPPAHKAPPPNDDAQSDTPSSPPRSKKRDKRKEKTKQKLEQELPTVTRKPPRGQSAASVPTSEDDRNWLQRTDITDALAPWSSNKWTVNLKPMGSEMHAVMKLSFMLCQMHLVFRDLDDPQLTAPEQVAGIVTGFDNAGMNDFALQALVKAAMDKGYDGENDIVDRLLYGLANLYVDPLVGYKAAASTFPSVVQVSSLPAAELEELGQNFIFPRTGAVRISLSQSIHLSSLIVTCQTQGTWDTKQPFAGAGLGETIRAMFFGTDHAHSLGLRNISKMTSSLSSAAREHEIPAAMIALAATAIHSVLLDAQTPITSSKGEEFAGPVLGGAYKGYLESLLRTHKAKPRKYHKITHQLYIVATNGRAMSGATSQSDIIARVNWDGDDSD